MQGTKADRDREDQAAADALNDRVSRDWDMIRERVASVLLSSQHLTEVLDAAGAELTPASIHLDRQFYEGALLHCREIRNRYTFLDLAANSGQLASMVGTL